MLNRWLLIGLKRQITSTFLLLILTILAALQIPKIEIDTSVDSLIPYNDPARQVYQRVIEEFGSDNPTILYVRDEKLWTPEKLKALEALHREAVALPFVDRVDDLFTIHTIRGGDEQVTSYPTVIAKPPETLSEAAEIRELALQNRLMQGNYLSEDGAATAIILSIGQQKRGEGFHQHVNQNLQQLVGRFQQQFDEVRQIGASRIHVEIRERLFDDFKTLGGLSIIVLVIATFIFLRSAVAALIPIFTSVISIIWALGFMGWADIPLNILSAMLPSLLIVIGSTEDTHLLSTYLSQLKEGDKRTRHMAVEWMVKRLGLPVILTIITTAIGFSSNLFSDIEMIRQFSLAASVSILANGVVTLLMVPLILAHFGPLQNRSLTRNGGLRLMPRLVSETFNFVQQHFPRLLLISTALLCGFLLFHAQTLHVTNDPMSYFKEDEPLIQDATEIHKQLSGIKMFYVVLESDREKAFQYPENIRKLADIQHFIRSQSVFDRSNSIADYLAVINYEFNNRMLPLKERSGLTNVRLDLPETRELVAQYLLFFHRRDLQHFLSEDMRRASIIVRHNISDSHTLNRHVRELQEVANILAGSSLKAHIVGENLLVNQAAEELMIGQVKSLLLILIIVFVIMSVMFTSMRGGVIAVVTAIIPIILMFGIMGLFGIPLNPGTAMVAVIAIGVAIDGTIHLFSHYNERCRHTSNYPQAVRETVRDEATPLVTTSLVLASGFAVLMLSNFTVIAQFGALASLTMLFSIFANLLVTPVILTYVRLAGLHQVLSVEVEKGVLENSPFFAGMTNYQRYKAIFISESREFRQGELIIRQGAVESDMYLLLSGRAVVYRNTADGQRIELSHIEPGDLFGEIAFIRASERSADIEAIEDVSVLSFNADKLKKDLKFFPNIVARLNFNISYILAGRLADAVQSIGEKVYWK